jgi:hypothetical protein
MLTESHHWILPSASWFMSRRTVLMAPSTRRSLKLSLPLKFSYQNSVCSFHFPQACNMTPHSYLSNFITVTYNDSTTPSLVDPNVIVTPCLVDPNVIVTPSLLDANVIVTPCLLDQISSLAACSTSIIESTRCWRGAYSGAIRFQPLFILLAHTKSIIINHLSHENILLGRHNVRSHLPPPPHHHQKKKISQL